MATQTSPNFTVGNVHVSAPLTQLSIGYHPAGMIAERVFPVIKVAHENDLFLIWDKPQAVRAERSDGFGSLKADKSQARELNFGGTYGSYQAAEFALRTSISDRERQNQDPANQLELAKIRRLQDLVLLDQEIRIANLLTTTANYSASNFTTLAGANQWNNASFVSQSGATQSIIKSNIDTAKEAVRQNTLGLEANTIIIPPAVARVMMRDVGIVEQVKYTNPALLVGGYLPQTLWGMNVLMPNAVDTTTIEGEVPTFTDVWGKNVIVAYVNPAPGLDQVTSGAIFRVRDWQVKTWRDESIDVTYYQPSLVQAEKFVAPVAAYLINAAIA